MTAPTVVLPPHVRDALHTSGGQGAPLVVSYTDSTGRNRPSYRGSTHVDGDSRLTAWIRNPAGGLPSYVSAAGTAAVEVIYRNPRTDAFYRIDGIAHLAADAETCDRVYRESPPQEQMADPQRRGVALVIDVHRIAGHDANGPVLIESDFE